VDILQARFYSVAEDQDDPKYLLVRARVAGSKHGPRPRSQRHQTGVTDYRAHIRRHAVGKAIAGAVTDIDYIKLHEQHRG
jgi:hypothetical protein